MSHPDTKSKDDSAIAKQEGLQKSDSNTIKWQKKHGEYPRNWRLSRKTYDTVVIIFFEFFTTLISTTGPSAAKPASKEYHLSHVVSLVVFTLMYQIGQALGGLLMPPFSESFGRRKPYIYSCTVYCVSCLIIGLVRSVAGAVVGRLVSGFASAIPSVVIAGSIEDLYDNRERVWLIFLWNSFTTLGLVLGPIYGSYIHKSIGWFVELKQSYT
jgi:MFS family permease